MTEGNAAKDLASTAAGEQGSSAKEGAGSAETVSRADFDALKGSVETLVKKLETLPEQLKQSQRDTVSDRVRKAVGESLPDLSGLNAFLETVKPYLKEGVNPKQVSNEVLLDALRQAVSHPAGATESPQASAQQAAKPAPNMLEVELQSILDEHGLTGKEPELKEYMAQNRGKGLRELLNGFSELSEQLASRQTGDAGSIVAGATGKRASPDMIRQYVADMMKSRGQGFAVARNIKEKYRRLGVDVDHIDLLRPPQS